MPSQGPEMEKVKNFITQIKNNSYNSSDNNKNPLCLYRYFFNVKYFAVVSKFNYNIALLNISK